MVKAQEWLDKNYPENSTCINEQDQQNYGKRRNEIVELDISNKNLEDRLDRDGGWTNLRKLNVSFNSITGGTVGHTNEDNTSRLEEVDYAYNFRPGDVWGGSGKDTVSFPNLKKLNVSHLAIGEISLSKAPQLTHLDVSNNSLEELNLNNNKNLVKLNCSNNPFLSKLNLPSSFNPASLDFFDCRGTSLGNISTPSSLFDCQNDIIYSPTPLPTTITAPTDISNFPIGIILGSSIIGGFVVLGIPVLITCYIIKKRDSGKNDTELKNLQEIKSLEEKIQSKKNECGQLENSLQEGQNSEEIKSWLERIKISNPKELNLIKETLEPQGIDSKPIEQLYMIQKEIKELEEKKMELINFKEPELTEQIQVAPIPSTSRS